MPKRDSRNNKNNNHKNNNNNNNNIRKWEDYKPTHSERPHKKQKSILDEIDELARINSLKFIKEKQVISIGETLFWKIFRNIVLYRNIMSFMNKDITPGYDSIINVVKMLNNGNQFMLVDKVMRKKYLVFNVVGLPGVTVGTSDILKLVKITTGSVERDILYYKNLFNNYGDIILEQSALGNETLFVNELIAEKGGNVIALQILVQYFNYELTESNFQTAIGYGRIKFIDLMLKHKPEFKTNIDSILSNHKECCKSNSFKSLVYLQSENIIDCLEISKVKNIIKRNETNVNETMSLKSLLSLCKFLSLFTKAPPYRRSFLAIFGYLDPMVNENGFHLNIEQVDSISNSFKKEELKLNIVDILVSNPTKKQDIIKLFDFYYSYSKINKERLLNYNIYFKNETKYFNMFVVDQIPLLGYSQDLKKLILSLRFGNSEMFIDWLNTAGIFGYNVYDLNGNDFFGFCSYETQIKLVDSVVSDISTREFSPSFLSIPTKFFNLIVMSDNLELIKYTIEKLSTVFDLFSKNNNGIFKNPSFYHVTSHIKSIKVLEYLFENHYMLINKTGSAWFFRNSQLLKRYEELHNEKHQDFDSISFDLNQFHIDFKCDSRKQVLEHIINSNSSIYKIKYQQPESFYKIINDSIGGNKRYELFNLFFANFMIKPTVQLLRNDTNPSLDIIKFIDSFYSIGQLEINLEIDKPYLQLFQLKTNRFNEIQVFNILPTKQAYLCLFGEDSTENIQLLDWVLKKLIIKSNFRDERIEKSNYIYRIVCSACKSGKLTTLKHISRNFKSILYKSRDSSTDGGLFHDTKMKESLFHSLSKSHFQISKFLFNCCKISKLEFNEHSSELSKQYFLKHFV